MSPHRVGGSGHADSPAVAYHEAIAEKWTQRYAGRGFQERLRCFKKILGRNVGLNRRWLDLGCGSGVLTAELIECGATQIVAIDGSPAMLEHAALAVGRPLRADVEWIRADVRDISFLPAGSFDGVLCSSVIEYVDRPDEVVRGIARVLRPGGRFVISVPPKHSFVRRLQKISRRFASLLGKDVFSYLAVSRYEVDPASVESWLKGFGLSTTHATRFDPILSDALSKLLRPSLLLLEGRKIEHRGD